MIFRLILGAVLSYLLGSLNFGIILSRKFQKEDVRTHGSGNAGSTNMLRNYGKLPAVATILGDMAKVAAEDAGQKVRCNLAEYLEKGIVK